MDVNFFEPEAMYSVIARRFQVRFLFSVLWVNRCVFPLWGLLQILLVLLSYCLYIHPFRYVLLAAIFLSKIVRFLWHTVVGMFSCYPLPTTKRIFFRCFGMFCFVFIISPFVDISFISLLSPVFSGLFFQVVLLFFFFRVVFSFLFLHIPASFFCFIIFACFRSFFYFCVSSRISHLGFDFYFSLFKGIPIFSQTNFAPA